MTISCVVIIFFISCHKNSKIFICQLISRPSFLPFKLLTISYIIKKLLHVKILHNLHVAADQSPKLPALIRFYSTGIGVY